jgi:hypothetical protein
VVVQADLGKKQEPISKIARAERAGGVEQTIECLPTKHPEFKTQVKKKRGKER